MKTRLPDVSHLGVQPSRFGVGDLVSESLRATAQQPLRAALTALGTILGAAAFVAALGLSSTMTQQVSEQFDAHRATEVLVRVAGESSEDTWLSSDALNRLSRLNGVVHAGRRLTAGELAVRRESRPEAEFWSVRVIAADPAALVVMAPRIRSGRTYDNFHEKRGEPVVLLSSAVAERLGIARAGPAVYIGPRAYTVIGIYDDTARREEAMLALLMPYSLGHGVLPDPMDADVVVQTAPGAAETIARQAPLALHPVEPTMLQSVAPPDPDTFRRSVEDDVTQLSFLLSGVALFIGVVSIANSATAGVVGRVPEIGLRRALGARPRHIFAQLVGETAVLGGVGGTAGAVVGVVITVAVSLWNGWQPILDLSLALVASVGGAVAGALAGLAPAVRATRIQPVDALQR